jgi:cbb3-type cytochrome oxidase subunit 3
MKKNKSYIFLTLLVLVFLIVGVYMLDQGKKERNEELKEIIKKADDFVNQKDNPEFSAAWDYMDDCLEKDPLLADYEEFKSRYERLSNILKAGQSTPIVPSSSNNQ